MNLKENIKDNFPFISAIMYGNAEYVGIIINQDPYVTSIYDFELLSSDKDKSDFLSLGDTWWWESNRTIPINIFLKNDMEKFRYAITTMNSKDVSIIFGPTVNLHQMANKRVKRRIIQLIKPIKR